MNAANALRLVQLLCRLVGYISAAQASAEGFTHHGKYFGLPIWMTAGDGPAVACKWKPLDYLFVVFVWIEQTMREVLYPDHEPGFQILQGPPIVLPAGSTPPPA